ncbi:MAG: pyruvate kinase [bacterium]
MKRTKIVATIGPACNTKKVLLPMVKAGLNVARFNFSHGDYSMHAAFLEEVRQSAWEVGERITILQDLQGPRIRIGEVDKKGIRVKKNQEVVFLYSEKSLTRLDSETIIPIHIHDLYKYLRPKERVLIEDGLIELRVKKVIGKKIICEVMVAGVIKTHKGMNFPDSFIKTDPITKKDIADLEFGVKSGVDFVAMSFVSSAQDVRNLRRLIIKYTKKHHREKDGLIKIIAKIERKEAIKNLDAIIKEVDGVMVARGDMGVELPFEEVPMIQKRIIAKCNYAGKPVIVATQMLDSMIRNPRPTRAEVSDVANAILDGTDAIMLSGESASGKYPVQAVKAMQKISLQVEPAELKLQQRLEPKWLRVKSKEDQLAFNAQDMAEKMGAKAIVCWSDDTDLARKIIRYKSRVPFYFVSKSDKAKQQINLSWGSEAIDGDCKSVDELLMLLKKNKKVKTKDRVIVVIGSLYGWWKKNVLEIKEV